MVTLTNEQAAALAALVEAARQAHSAAAVVRLTGHNITRQHIAMQALKVAVDAAAAVDLTPQAAPQRSRSKKNATAK